jgi:hypothetical protein
VTGVVLSFTPRLLAMHLVTRPKPGLALDPRRRAWTRRAFARFRRPSCRTTAGCGSSSCRGRGQSRRRGADSTRARFSRSANSRQPRGRDGPEWGDGSSVGGPRSGVGVRYVPSGVARYGRARVELASAGPCAPFVSTRRSRAASAGAHPTNQRRSGRTGAFAIGSRRAACSVNASKSAYPPM